MAKDPFENAYQLRMRAVFDRAIQDGAHHAIADPNLRKLEERIEQLSEKAVKHFARHKPSWIAKENSKLVAEHKGKLKPSLTPKWIVQTETSPAALAKRAFSNVEQRIEKRLERIELIANRLRNKIGPDDPNGGPLNRNKIGM